MHIDEKIKVIKKLYSDHNIKYLSLDEFQTVKKINITDENFLYIKKLFRSEKEKPTDSTGLKYLIVGALKNLIGKLKIINMVQDKLKNNVSVYNYSFDDEKIKFYNELFKKIKKNEVY
jgi:glycerophosphoryl diester phosphodiesterase